MDYMLVVCLTILTAHLLEEPGKVTKPFLDHFGVKMRTTRSFATAGTAFPTKRHHIPVDFGFYNFFFIS
jgi:hypothetical protein